MKLRIKELRKARGWTVEQLAEIVGLSKSYVSEIENGKKQANQLRVQKFASAFGVHVLELLDEETLGSSERMLFEAFAKMDDNKRLALLAIANEMTR